MTKHRNIAFLLSLDKDDQLQAIALVEDLDLHLIASRLLFLVQLRKEETIQDWVDKMWNEQKWNSELEGLCPAILEWNNHLDTQRKDDALDHL